MDIEDVAGNPMIRNALGDSFPASPRVTLDLCDKAGVNADSHALHLGAGVGTVCQMIMEHFGCHVTGLIEDEALLKFATCEDPKVSYIVGSMRAPDLPAGTFSHVLIECRTGLFNDPRPVLEAAMRMLRPEGVLILDEPVLSEDGELPPTLSEMLPQRLALHTEAALSAALQETGFDITLSADAPEVTERILEKLDRISTMLKMAIRIYRFDPSAFGIPYTKKQILTGFDEVRNAIRDGTFGWHLWLARRP